MATIHGDKLKLINYGYILEPNGFSTNSYVIDENIVSYDWVISYNGNRSFNKKLIDAFDIDWKPFGIQLDNGEKFDIKTTSDLIGCVKSAMSNYKLETNGKEITENGWFHDDIRVIENIHYDRINQQITYTYLLKPGSHLNNGSELFLDYALSSNLALGSYSFIAGSKNTLNTKNSYSFIFGSRNDIDNSGNTSYIYVSGNDNKVKGNWKSTNVFGSFNEIITHNSTHESFDNTILGSNNISYSLSNSFISGSNNIVSYSRYVSCFGGCNIVFGTYNFPELEDISNIQNTGSGIFGWGNLVYNTAGSIIGGLGNTLIKNDTLLSNGWFNEISYTNSSIINGQENKVSHTSKSIIVGNTCYVTNNNSGLVVGDSLNTYNSNESAIGKFNVSNEGQIFAVGIGEDKDNRKNAFEVYEDGSVVINNLDVSKLKVDNLDATLFSGPNMIELNYLDLVNLIDTNKLFPGKFYKIMDYRTLVNHPNAFSTQKTAHVVVLALSPNLLSPDGWMIDTTDQNKIYKIKYDIVSDSTKYDWAGDSFGVIYWMQDEYNNEAPFDFTSIQFRNIKLRKIDQNGTLFVTPDETNGTNYNVFAFHTFETTSDSGSYSAMRKYYQNGKPAVKNCKITSYQNSQDKLLHLPICVLISTDDLTCENIVIDNSNQIVISQSLNTKVYNSSNTFGTYLFGNEINGSNDIYINSGDKFIYFPSYYLTVENGCGNLKIFSSFSIILVKILGGLNGKEIDVPENTTMSPIIYSSSATREILI